MIEVSSLEIILATLAFASSVIVVASRNPIVSAISLMATLFFTGGIYFAVGAYFIGAAQILIYAGAVAVLFAFIVMLLDLRPVQVSIPGRSAIVALGILAGLLIITFGVSAIVSNTEPSYVSPVVNMESLQPVEIAKTFISKYMVAFQMTGFLILAAIMGSILLGRPQKTGKYG